jgi:hypothetical protein
VTWPTPQWRDERGQVGNVEVLPFGLLVFVIGALLVTNAWAVIDARGTAASASREAVRAYAEASDAFTADRDAREAAANTAIGHGRDPGRLRLDIEPQGPFARCVPVTIRASYEVPALHLPWIGGFGHAFDVVDGHTELIDPYRSGLGGEAQC